MTAIPLQYLSATVATGDTRASASASSSLTAPQQGVKLGEPVPIVFCRRVSSNGGVFISPKATEARFDGTSGTPDTLAVKYILVVSEGDLPQMPIKDCWIGACREGSWNQSFDRRAKDWVPGVYGANVVSLPGHCGTSGRYENMTTLSVEKTYNRVEDWNHKCNVFIREGIKVTRLLDSVLGPSNNIADLTIYLMKQSQEVPDALIDTAQMIVAANFANANGLLFNGEISSPINLVDWLQQTANGFLMRLVKKNGKFSLRPRVQVNSSNVITAQKVNWVYTFTEKHIIDNGIEINYVAAEDRKPVNYEVLWRQQSDTDVGYIRSTEIKMNGANAEVQTLDLSAFCTNETHAVKVAAYNVALRRFVSHYATITLMPGNYATNVSVGDIVRLRLRTELQGSYQPDFSFLYEIQSIQANADGTTTLSLMHYPLNTEGKSLLTLAVASATAPGSVYSLIRVSESCDDNSSTDDTLLIDDGVNFDIIESDSNFDVFDVADLTVDIPDIDLVLPDYIGPLPINVDGFEVSLINFDFGNIFDVDASVGFDPDIQPVAEVDTIDLYPDEIDPQAVVDELFPGSDAPEGGNTGIDAEGNQIPESSLDEDGNPLMAAQIVPLALPFEKWNNQDIGYLVNKLFVNPGNKNNEFKKWYVNTSLFLNYTTSALPWGPSNTGIKFYQVEGEVKTQVGPTILTPNPTYPTTECGYTATASDIGKKIEAWMFNTVNTSEEVLWGRAVGSPEDNGLDYDWCQINFSVPTTASIDVSNVYFGKRFATDSYPKATTIGGRNPGFETSANAPYPHGQGWGEGWMGEGENETGMMNYFVSTTSKSHFTGALRWHIVSIVVNISAYRIVFPNAREMMLDFMPNFGALQGGDHPTLTQVDMSIDAKFYKGGLPNEGETTIQSTTLRPITATKQSLARTDNYTVTSIIEEYDSGTFTDNTVNTDANTLYLYLRFEGSSNSFTVTSN